MGMSWARAAIFYGSDRGKEILVSMGVSDTTATILPPLFVSTAVQCVNMPLVRSTILLQNPESNVPNIRESLRQIYTNHGLGGLWHGTSAGILKTVPKYCTAIFVKDYMERALPAVDPESPTRDRDRLLHSAIKSSAAGVAGAVLTNPLDVIRNEMFKTNLGLFDAIRSLHSELGLGFLIRGMSRTSSPCQFQWLPQSSSRTSSLNSLIQGRALIDLCGDSSCEGSVPTVDFKMKLNTG